MIHFSDNSLEKVPEDRLSAWVPTTHKEHPDGVQGSWLQPALALTIAAIGAGSQTADERFLPTSPPSQLLNT